MKQFLNYNSEQKTGLPQRSKNNTFYETIWSITYIFQSPKE